MVLGAGALLYVLAVLTASMNPSARNWGVHLPAFLPTALRFTLIALLVTGAALVASGVFWKKPGNKVRSSARVRRPSSQETAFLTRRGWILLVPYVALLWILRSRTEFLGDGAVWLGSAQSGIRELHNEPLFAVTWHGFAALLRALRLPVEADTLRTLAIASGFIAALLMVGIAREVTPGGPPRLVAFLLLFTIGSMQLYFGYIESYPVASLFILAFLWTGLRYLNGRPFWPVSVSLTLAIATHLSALFLVPAHFLLAFRRKESVPRRLIDAATPLAGAAALLVLLGYRATNWKSPFEAATRGFRESFAGPLYHRPYEWFSLQHAGDIGNAFLLILPVPLLLLAWWIGTPGARQARAWNHLPFLSTAAASGVLMTASLMTPVAPAQDWDLTAMFLIPTAVLGAAMGIGPAASRLPKRVSIGLVMLSTAGLLSFVLVNAGERSSLARFKVLVADKGSVSPYGRAYGNELLDRYYRDHGDYAAALPYARAAVAAETGNPRYWINLGNDLYELHLYGEAIPMNLEAIRRGSGRWEPRYNLGLCYIETGRYDEAVTTLREAVRLEGNRPELRHDLGIALYKSGKPDSAFAVWQEILVRWPDYAAAMPDSGR